MWLPGGAPPLLVLPPAAAAPPSRHPPLYPAPPVLTLPLVVSRLKGSDCPCERLYNVAAASHWPEGQTWRLRGNIYLAVVASPSFGPSPLHPKAKPLHRNRSTFRNLLPTPLTSIRPRPLGAAGANNNTAVPPPPPRAAAHKAVCLLQLRAAAMFY